MLFTLDLCTEGRSLGLRCYLIPIFTRSDRRLKTGDSPLPLMWWIDTVLDNCSQLHYFWNACPYVDTRAWWVEGLFGPEEWRMRGGVCERWRRGVVWKRREGMNTSLNLYLHLIFKHCRLVIWFSPGHCAVLSSHLIEDPTIDKIQWST